MPLFIKDTKRALFVHIPKTAGTSIESAFLDAGYSKQFINRPGKGDGPDHKPCNPQHWHMSFILKNIYPVLVNKSFFEFAIVRNPFTRLISEMMWRNKGRNDFENDSFYEFFDDYVVKGIKAYLDNERNYKEHPDRFAGGGQSFYQDNHWRPQKEFVGPKTVIFKYEDLKYQAWADFKMRFSLGELASEFTDLPLDKQRPTSMKIKPSDDFVKLYTQVYGDDHKRFGYDMPFNTGE